MSKFLEVKKFLKNKINKKIFFDNDNLILSDVKGNIIIYSTKEKKISQKFNFYKKTHKSIIKNLNLVIKNEIIYVSDNLGYIYAYNYKKKIKFFGLIEIKLHTDQI